MNLRTDTRPGLYEARVPASPIAPQPAAQQLVATLPVAQLPVAATQPPNVLEAAIAKLAVLDRALSAAAAARFDSRSNAVARWMATHPKGTHMLGFAIPALSVCPVNATWLPVLAGIIGTGIAGGIVQSWLAEKRTGAGEPLTTAQVAAVVSTLREMPPAERAWLKAYADRSIENRVGDNSLTPAAAESLNEALNEGLDPETSALRTGELALLVHTAKRHHLNWTEWFNDWFKELLDVLKAYPADQRREMASILIAVCFEDERCTLPIRTTQADSLYGGLRAMQKTTD